MAVYSYGMSVVKSPTKEVNYESDVIGKNSEAFTAGDPVTLSSGYLAVAGTTDSIYGIVVKTQTMASDNQTVAKVKPSYIPVDQNYEFLMGTNSDLAVTTVGVYYKLTAATTGTVQVDVSSGAQTTTNRVVICTKVDPNGLGGTGAGSGLRQGLFRIVKPFVVKSNA